MKRLLVAATLAALVACHPGGTDSDNYNGGDNPLRITSVAKDCDGDNTYFKDKYLFTYNARYRVESFRWESGDPDDPYIIFRHDGKIYADGEPKDKEADKAGRLTLIKGGGNKTTFIYNEDNRLATAVASYVMGPNENKFDPQITDTPLWSKDGDLSEYTQLYHSDGSSVQVVFGYSTAAAKNPFAGMAVDPLSLILMDFLNSSDLLKYEACGVTGFRSARFPSSFTVKTLDTGGDSIGDETFAINVTSTTPDGYPEVLAVGNENTAYTYTLTYEGKPNEEDKPQIQGLSLAASTFGPPVKGERGIYLELVSTTDAAAYRKAASFIGYEIYLWVKSSGDEDSQPVPTGTFSPFGSVDDYRHLGPGYRDVCDVVEWRGAEGDEMQSFYRTVITDKGEGRYSVSVIMQTEVSDNDILFSWEGPITLTGDGNVHFNLPS